LVEVHGVTPVEKVTELLEQLAAVVTQEGKEEAAAYDKYSCFCKEESSDKLYAIERSQDKIAKLDAKIAKLSGEISALEAEISGLGTKITNLGTEIDKANAARKTTHEAFLTSQKDAADAIDTIERAIEALKSSKGDLRGRVEMEAPSLTQVRAAVSLAVSRSTAPGERLMQLKSLGGQPGEGYAYKYHANDIIGTLETLRTTFKRQKRRIEDDEFASMSAHEMDVQSKSNERKFAQKEKAEKEQVHGSKTDERSATTADRDQENKEKTADEKFLGVLKADCESKAQLWDQRSSTRAGELTAIDKAVEQLKGGVASNWKANEKLVGLQREAKGGHWAPSFLQLRGRDSRGRAQIAEVQQDLARAAKRLGSPVLSVAALKVLSSKDHFVKVRQLIKDLIGKLEDDATAEQTEKTFCDTEMANAVKQRDDNQASAEDLAAQVAGKEADKSRLKEEIAELSDQIAKNQKALLETTQLRDEDKADNLKRTDEAQKGLAAVRQAISILETFYNNAFLQRSVYVPTNSDRAGKTLGDKAPEIFDSTYHGSKEESTGILHILQVIEADFDRTEMSVTSDESAAASSFSTFKSTNEADTATKQNAVKTKQGTITQIDDDLVNLRDSKSTAEENHKDALSELSKLHSRCVAGVETYEERVARRNKEIEALKRAHNILEEWSP